MFFPYHCQHKPKVYTYIWQIILPAFLLLIYIAARNSATEILWDAWMISFPISAGVWGGGWKGRTGFYSRILGIPQSSIKEGGRASCWGRHLQYSVSSRRVMQLLSTDVKCRISKGCSPQMMWLICTHYDEVEQWDDYCYYFASTIL